MPHTQGKWEIIEYGDIIRIECKKNKFSGRSIAKLADFGLTKENKANAQLIASAPELLEACKSIKPLLYHLEGKISETKLHMFVQAINKAEGVV